MFKVLVCGGRDFRDRRLMHNTLDSLLKNKLVDGIVIVSGCAAGADSLAVEYANEKGYQVEPHPAEWEKYGKKAGYVRNIEMVEEADAVVAFWDGKSKGTGHSIKMANELHRPIRVIKYNSL